MKLKRGQKICKKCNKILDKDEFPEKRNQCRKCRNSVRSKLGDKFDEKIEEEVEELRNMKDENMLREKLDKYVKTELHKIMTYIELGRKYNDRKSDCVTKLYQYFVKI